MVISKQINQAQLSLKSVHSLTIPEYRRKIKLSTKSTDFAACELSL